MGPLDELGERVRAAFEQVHRDVFRGDPVANARLAVDVVDAATVDDTPTLVLVTPWTVNGLVVPPDEDFPGSLAVAGRRRPVSRVDLAGVGAYRSVALPVTLHSTAQARNLARSWIPALQQAVRAARASRTPADRCDPPSSAVAEPVRSTPW